jgi:hypothetical protein
MLIGLLFQLVATEHASNRKRGQERGSGGGWEAVLRGRALYRCGSIRSGVGARVFVFICVSSLLTLSPSLPLQKSSRMRTLSHTSVGLTMARFLPSHTSVHGAGAPSCFLPTFPFPCSIPASSRSSAHHTLLFASAHSRYHHTCSSTYEDVHVRK